MGACRSSFNIFTRTQSNVAPLDAAGALATFDVSAVVTKKAQSETGDRDELAELQELLKKRLVDGRRLELPTSALRTRRSPS